MLAGMEKYKREMLDFWQEWSKLGSQAFTGLVQTFEDSFVAGMKGNMDDVRKIWKNFLDDLLNSFLRILAKMATQALMAPIIVPIFGMIMGNTGTAMAEQALGMSPGSSGNMLGLAKYGQAAFGGKGLYGGLMNWGMTGGSAAGSLAAGGMTPSAISLQMGQYSGAGMGSMVAPGAISGSGGYMATMMPYLGAGALGYMGYTTIGAQMGLPQGKYSGVGAGLGAMGGMAIGAQLGTVGGPIGMIAGAIVGGIIGSMFGKEKDTKVKGHIGAKGDILDMVDINDIYIKAKHAKFKAKDITKEMGSVVDNVKSQYEGIFKDLPVEYRQAFADTFNWKFKKFSTKGAGKKFQKKLEKELAKMAKSLDITIQTYLTRQVKAYGKEQLGDISKTEAFGTLAKDSPVMEYYNAIVDVFNQSGNWNAQQMQDYLSAISELEGYIEDIASAVDDAFKDVRDTIARFELTDIQYELYKLQQWYDEQIETWESLEGILNQDQLNQHLNDINKAFEYLKQEIFDNFIDPLTQFFEDMSISDLAPVQSMERYQKLLEEKMLLAQSGNAADLQALMDFTKGSYLPFMKAFGEGDYNTIYTQLMDILKGLTESLKLSFMDQTLRKIQPIDSYQHGTDYVPQTGTYVLHKGEKVITAEQNQSQEIHIHLDVDGRQIGYVVAKDIKSNGELINAVRRAIH